MKLVKIDDENSIFIRDFDCLNKEEDLTCFKNKKVKKFHKFSDGLNFYLKQKSLKEQKEGLSTTHILIENERIVGFVSTCSDSIKLVQSEKERDSVPYEIAPAIKIAKLAIDKNHQREGIGKLLIDKVIATSLIVRDYIGVKFITVDCYEHRQKYYEKHGFVVNAIQKEDREPDSPLSLRLNIDEFLDKLDV